MADKGGKKEERQMLFDLRGRRRNVVKVVYAILAVLMALSLLLIAGPLPFGDIFGAQDSAELAREQNEERVERIEVKLKQSPDDPALLLNLTRAHLTSAANLVEEVGPEQIALTPESRQEFEQAASAWDEYVEATGQPNAGTAQQMANTFLQLAETSTNLEDASRNITAAAEAQQIVADKLPSLGSLATLALYTVFTGDYAKAQKINEEAAELATSKFQRQQVENQFEETEKRAKAFQKELEEEKKLEKTLQESQSEIDGEGNTVNPFGLGGGSLSE